MVRIYTGPEALIYVKKELRSANSISVFYNDDEAIEVLNRYDPFESRRCILLKKDALKFTEKLISVIEQYKEDADTALVIQATSLDKSAVHHKKYESLIQECGKFSEQQLVAMLNKKISISKEAAKELIERSGYYQDASVNIYTLFMLLEQVAVQGDVTTEEITKFLPETPAKKAYLLAQMICQNQTELAIAESRKLLASNQSEISLLTLIQKSFKYAWREKRFGNGCTDLEKFRFAFASRFSEEQLRSVCEVVGNYISSCKKGYDNSICYWLCISEIHNILFL